MTSKVSIVLTALFATIGVIGLVWAIAVWGNNVGMMPSGASVEEIHRIRESWPPQKQIDDIMHSPMPYKDKMEHIAAIRAKYHLPADDSKSGPVPGTPPAPGIGGGRTSSAPAKS